MVTESRPTTETRPDADRRFSILVADDDPGNRETLAEVLRKKGFLTVTAADGKLIVLGDKGELVVAKASPAGFKPLARAQVLGGKSSFNSGNSISAGLSVYARNQVKAIASILERK